jgi:hypothetical protein
MKRTTATEARKNWFRLLDEVLAGEIVVLERKGRRIVLRLEESPPGRNNASPSYDDLFRVEEPDRADQWGWEWEGPGQDLKPSSGKRKKR